MGFSIGIIGLPNVGKTTIFNAITSICAEASNYPFCTIEPNMGVVPVADGRLDAIARIIHTESYLPTSITFIDIAGLVRGANRGEGLGNKFLSHIREVDGIAHIVRCFGLSDIVHVEGSVDPLRDIEIIRTELLLSDLEIVERKIEKLVKAHTPDQRKLVDFLRGLADDLNNGRAVGSSSEGFQGLSDDERHAVRELNLITLKPQFFVANVDEKELTERRYFPIVETFARREGREVVAVCGRLEEEISQLEGEDKAAMLREYGLDRDAVNRIILTGYRALRLITFFTTARKELKAWTVEEGTHAAAAAGRIHSDMERGFIRAEVVHYDDLMRAGSEQKARDLGLYRLEGRDYAVKDGDVIYFRFKV